jgi:hypothetical protein
MKKILLVTSMLLAPALLPGQGALSPADMLKPLAE